MRSEDLAAQQRPHLLRTEQGHHAFVPPPLPPDLAFATDLVSALSMADRAVGELAGIGRTLPNTYLFAQAMMRREAVLSSRIDGTQATLSELVLFEVEHEPRRGNSDVREVANYVSALDHLLNPDRQLPLSLRLLCEARRATALHRLREASTGLPRSWE